MLPYLLLTVAASVSDTALVFFESILQALVSLLSGIVECSVDLPGLHFWWLSVKLLGTVNSQVEGMI